MAYEIGAFEANMPRPEGSSARAEGKYVVIWKRQADETIKMTADIFNLDAYRVTQSWRNVSAGSIDQTRRAGR